VKRFMLAMVLIGIALLGVIVYHTDLGEVWAHLRQIPAWGLLLLFAVYFVGVTAALGGMGGEPIKAIVMKRHYGVPYRDASASLVLNRTTDAIGLLAFISIGLALMVHAQLLPLTYRAGAVAGLAFLAVGVSLFVWVQRGRAFSRIRHWLEQGRLGDRLSARVVAALDVLRDVEDRLVGFYAQHRRWFALSVAAAFLNWATGALATYIAMDLLGHPISLVDAVVIEACMLLVRSLFFFVPADIGTQEGALVLACGAITGSPPLGLALAAIRRARDLLFVVWGLGIGFAYSLGVSDVREAARSVDPVPSQPHERRS
jgi:uncharacterized membrane protein YbhN (UPF0104 family)